MRLGRLLGVMRDRGNPVTCVGMIEDAGVKNLFSQYIAVKNQAEKHRRIIQVVHKMHPRNVVFFCREEVATRMFEESPFHVLKTLFLWLIWRVSRKTIG